MPKHMRVVLWFTYTYLLQFQSTSIHFHVFVFYLLKKALNLRLVYSTNSLSRILCTSFRKVHLQRT
ncbi:hypothetical protein P153DRAFT_14502 [Dothidotthia symphoricarpi CBS 119687]|uniref:Uncharacterized protein n=1 Tax=Dothidotthia symphoricarpi CBS 119687 TaxID=1392245 RepID=A0A6A6ATL3_9PLEO|nr:uncharacterized protein P153DRAFT_14502 [Dothidotthia symphoricarpi CBS 119687]KAF2135020.1 hypothetical protein P153DRAFT_14502 [Dothidotthia symphoricarpi CBS 119687]